MKETYFVNTKQYDHNCLKSVISKAISIAKADEEVGQIIIVVPTKTQFGLLESVFSEKVISGRCYHVTGANIGVRFETVKTLSPYLSCKAVFVALCLSQKDLIKYEDEWSFRYWIVVPWHYSELESWLKVHSAIDVATNIPIEANYSVDEKIQNAIGWLKATSYPNEGFIHPLDLNRLKSMSNAIAQSGIIADYDAVLHYCLNHGIWHKGGRRIAEYFVNAQTKKFKTDGNYSFKFLVDMMNEKHRDL